MAEKNGRLTKLTDIGQNQRLAPGAAESWLELVADAAEAGHAVLITDSYRPEAVQIRVFTQRYTTIYSDSSRLDRKEWEGRVYWRRPHYASAAVPGTSNHGWGTAVDIRGINNGFGNPPHPTYQWLARHAGKYGWTNPSWAKTKNFWEPWHWEYDPNMDTKKADREKRKNEMKSSYFSSKTNRKLPKAWTLVRVGEKNEVSICTREGQFSSLVQLKVTGLKPGEVLQGRFIRVAQDSKGNWVTKVKYPITEIIGTSGGTFSQAAQMGTLEKGQRLRFEVLAPTTNVVIDEVQARTYTFNV